MTTVREASFELFREHGMTTMFGNPGSTELPMLADFPDDFRYVLGLQEAVAVGMADGFAQASGSAGARQPAHGARASATRWARSSTRRRTSRRCVVTAGQQARVADDAAGQPDQPRRDADAAPARQVELRAAARRGRAARARARDPPGGAAAAGARCSSRSRWTTGTPRSTTAARAPGDRAHGRRPRGRRPRGGRRRSPSGSPRRRTRCWSPGPTSTPRGAWDAAVALAERQRLPVWATPAPGGGRIGFPEGHPQLPGRPAAGDRPARARRSPATTSSSSSASSVFPYYPNIPGPLLPEGAALVAITSDPDEAARAPMGDAIVADVALTLEALLDEVGESDRERRRSRCRRPRPPPRLGPDQRHRRRCATLADVFPEDGIVVLESPVEHARAAQPAAPLAARAATTSAPAAASASASPPRSACSSPSPTARSSACSARARPSTRSRPSGRAAAYEVPVTFLVLRNDEYAILKWFAELESVDGRARARPAGARHAPRSPTATASPSQRVSSGADELHEALARGDRRRRAASWSRSRSRRAWRSA